MASTSLSRKRKQKEPGPLKWGPKVPLSKFPTSQQKKIYREKLDPIEEPSVCERPVDIDELRGYGLVERFEYLGWEAGLTYCNGEKDEIYIDEAKEWMSTLKRIPGTNPPLTTKLKGRVNGKDVYLSMDILSNIAPFDSGIKVEGGEYTYVTDAEMYSEKETKKPEWYEMIDTLFDVPDGNVLNYKPLTRQHLKPLPHLISKIMMHNIIPRKGDHGKIRHYEVKVLYALTTGRIHLSLKQLILLNIWTTRENHSRSFVPHCRLITHLLEIANAIPRDATPDAELPNPFSKSKLSDAFYFTETNDRFILTCKDSQRTFEIRKNGEEEEGMRNIEKGNEICGRVHAGQPQVWGPWSQIQQAVLDQIQRNHEENMRRWDEWMEYQRQIDWCNLYERELYQQRWYEYTKRLRHNMNLQRNQGYHPFAESFNYSSATPDDRVNLPPYPGFPPPLHWPQGLGASRNIEVQNLFDTST